MLHWTASLNNCRTSPLLLYWTQRIPNHAPQYSVSTGGYPHSPASRHPSALCHGCSHSCLFLQARCPFGIKLTWLPPLPPSRCSRLDAWIVPAFCSQPFTEVHEYGPLNVHLGVQEKRFSHIGFTPPPFIGQHLPLDAKYYWNSRNNRSRIFLIWKDFGVIIQDLDIQYNYWVSKMFMAQHMSASLSFILPCTLSFKVINYKKK